MRPSMISKAGRHDDGTASQPGSGSSEETETEKLNILKNLNIDGLDRLKPQTIQSKRPYRVRLSTITRVSGDSLHWAESYSSSSRLSFLSLKGIDSDLSGPHGILPAKPAPKRSLVQGLGQGVECKCRWCHAQCLSLRKDGCQECLKRRCAMPTLATRLFKVEKERKEEARLRSCKTVPIHTWGDENVALDRRIKWEANLAKERRDEKLSRTKSGVDTRWAVPVIVVGAGMAGLSAAEELSSHGFGNVIILEASDRIGGRIHTATLGSDSDNVIDLGVSEIEHLKEWNTVYVLARNQGLLKDGGSTKSRWRRGHTAMVAPNNSTVCKGKKAIAYNMMINHEIATLNQLSSQTSRPDKIIQLSSSDYFRETLRRLQGHIDRKQVATDEPGSRSSRPLCPSVASAVGAYCKEIQYQHGDHLGDADVQTFFTSQFFTSVQDGMSGILNPLTEWFNKPGHRDNIANNSNSRKKPNPIKFNAIVTRVDWSEFTKENVKRGNRPMLSVACEDGRVFRARHVIITTPLGFLKSNARKLFNPSLPETKLSAIERLGFGAVCKAFILFQEPVHRRGFYIALTNRDDDDDDDDGDDDDNNDGKNTNTRTKSKIEKLIVSLKSSPSSHVVEVTFSDATPETLDDAEILKDLTRILESRLLRPTPAPVDFIKTSWSKDPLYRGTHPYVTSSGSRKDADILAKPIQLGSDPVLQFAGDATHKDYRSLLNAARASGLREAARLNSFYDQLHGYDNVNSRFVNDWNF